MKLLVTNDDGIDAPGLDALFEIAAAIGDAVVVAPADPHSMCSHRVTTTTPLTVEPRGDRRYAVTGTPADCVRVALAHMGNDVDFVLSGINAGGNLGADVYLSGTVAAVREAALFGKPGAAVSHFRRRGVEYDWPRAAAWLAPILRLLTTRNVRPGAFWNVNVPHLDPGAPDPEVVYCRLDPHPLPVRFRVDELGLHYDGNYFERRREPGCDVDVCFHGKIAVTELRLF